jgi:hypothetical protein
MLKKCNIVQYFGVPGRLSEGAMSCRMSFWNRGIGTDSHVLVLRLPSPLIFPSPRQNVV